MRFKGSLAKIQKTYTMKKTIITALLILVALTISAQEDVKKKETTY